MQISRKQTSKSTHTNRLHLGVLVGPLDGHEWPLRRVGPRSRGQRVVVPLVVAVPHRGQGLAAPVLRGSTVVQRRLTGGECRAAVTVTADRFDERWRQSCQRFSFKKILPKAI